MTKKLLWMLLCVFLLGAPLTVKILEKSWSEPMDAYAYEKGVVLKLSVSEKIFIYCYAYIFGPLGLLIALMSE